jgi:hypothetical protein
MLHPHGGILEGDIPHRNVPAANDPEQIWTDFVGSLERAALAIDHAPALEANVFEVLGVNQAPLGVVVGVRANGGDGGGIVFYRKWSRDGRFSAWLTNAPMRAVLGKLDPICGN